MKLQPWYEFTETEEQAKAMVKRENDAHPRRKKHRATYTPWRSGSPTDPAHFIVWLYR